MNPRVVAVKANKDYTLYLTFENGQERIFDMKPYLSIGVFRQLKNFSKFKNVIPFYGSISWATGQDICPDTLYMDSKKIKIKKYHISDSPLSSVAEPRAKYKKK